MISTCHVCFLAINNPMPFHRMVDLNHKLFRWMLVHWCVYHCHMSIKISPTKQDMPHSHVHIDLACSSLKECLRSGGCHIAAPGAKMPGVLVKPTWKTPKNEENALSRHHMCYRDSMVTFVRVPRLSSPQLHFVQFVSPANLAHYWSSLRGGITA